MPDKQSVKMPCEIRRIDLDCATFKGTHEHFEPTYVNYIFGNNGTGKSTIAKAIQSGDGVTYAPGKTSADYIPLVFNQEFIDNNVLYMNGVFTVNEVNIKIQEQIDAKTEQQTAASKAASDATAERDKKAAVRGNLLKQLQQDCWKKTESVRLTLEKTQKGKKGSAKAFTEEVRRHQPIEHDLEKLKIKCDAAFSDTAKRYTKFNTIPDASVLDNVEGSDILGIVIVNTAQTGLTSFLEEIGATDWFRQGHSEYHKKADGKCPYCARTLPEDFEKKVSESFDDKYEKNLKKLDDYLEAYRAAANALFLPLTQQPTEIYPALVMKPYNDKFSAAKGVISSNIEKIREKKADPKKIVELVPTAELLEELSDIIADLNKKIDENNAVVDAGPRKQRECTNQAFEHLAFMLKDLFEVYDRSDAVLLKEIQTLEGLIKSKNEEVGRLQGELAVLRTKTVETETAMKNINTMLQDAGFQGFKVVPKSDRVVSPDGKIQLVPQLPIVSYEVVRPETGQLAVDLSEGEKNFIAFLYFQQQVFGSPTAEGDGRQKIVVLDDPASSMDSNALFIIGEQVRKMVEICRNNADNRHAVVKDRFIKQIFILTHNAYFHREVAYLHADRYEFVSFFLVRKRENRSSVRLWEKRNPECPSEMMNNNPVKNSYAALWEEYKELEDISSPIPLMNVIRRILEYYFLQICGYDGSQLRQTILHDNKRFFTCDEEGNEDYTKFDMATAMLSYIASSTYGVNDGLHYVDDVLDVKQCKKTFQLIFHHMGQDQHFNMMMGIK